MRLTRPLTQALTRRLSDPPGFVLAAPSAPAVFPQPEVAVDLDFIGRQYYWNGAQRSEADFTSLVLNGATFGPQGLDFSTCSANPNITISLATLGLTMPPCVYGLAGYFISTPATAKVVLEIDDATQNERFIVTANSTGVINVQTIDNNVNQASQNPGSITPGSARFGIAYSANLNDVKASGNGTGATADTVATMPTVTTLRLGASVFATSFPPAILSRLWMYSAVKTQTEINTISTQIRDAPATPSWIWPGASVDLDFIRRRYYWNGLTRSEANFTTLVLNGATWGSQGLDFSTCTVNPSITIALATLGITMPPCVYGLGGYFLSAPAANKIFMQFDDGTNNERWLVTGLATGSISAQTLDNNVSQAAGQPGSGIPPSPSRLGISHSAQLNDVRISGNGSVVAADTSATMPTVTTLRLGCSPVAGSFPPFILSRLAIFSAIKTDTELTSLSAQMRDAP
jgi:hypothetical protein